ncbi:MAG: helix-turn-helix domain-containing protein [Candidatus Caldatribacteriaceae bacterium]
MGLNPELAKQVGEMLRQAREEKGLTLGQVGTATFVSERFLSALEGGRWENLPGRAYALGYLKIYARFLGLEQEKILELFHRAYGEEKHAEGEEQRVPGIPFKKPKNRRKKVLLVLLGLFVALCGVLLVFLAFPSLLSPQREGNSPSPSSEVATPAALELSPSPEMPKATFAVVLRLKAEDVAWVDVSSLGVTMFSGVLVPGKTYVFQSDGPIEVTGENGNKVRAWINEREAGYLTGDSGSFQEVFTP